jgi:hypothetical protein
LNLWAAWYQESIKNTIEEHLCTRIKTLMNTLQEGLTQVLLNFTPTKMMESAMETVTKVVQG